MGWGCSKRKAGCTLSQGGYYGARSLPAKRLEKDGPRCTRHPLPVHRFDLLQTACRVAVHGNVPAAGHVRRGRLGISRLHAAVPCLRPGVPGLRHTVPPADVPRPRLVPGAAHSLPLARAVPAASARAGRNRQHGAGRSVPRTGNRAGGDGAYRRAHRGSAHHGRPRHDPNAHVRRIRCVRCLPALPGADPFADAARALGGGVRAAARVRRLVLARTARGVPLP